MDTYISASSSPSNSKRDDVASSSTSTSASATATGKSRARLSALRTPGHAKSRYTDRLAGDETPIGGPLRFPSAPQLVRRLSHPPHSLSYSRRGDEEDGEFIKRAFDKLSVEPTERRRKSSAEIVGLVDMIGSGRSATPFEHIAERNPSRTSLASSPSAISYADASSLHSSKPLLSRSNGRQASNGTGRFQLEGTPRLSDSNMSWTDPFADTDSRLRMRRRSTISGYSVGSTDWLSLRRGSLASIEAGSSNGQPGGSGSAENPFAVPEQSSSTRWEQWAQAYRETMLQHVQSHPAANTALIPQAVPSNVARPLRPFRKISFTETLSSASSIHEQSNPFYPLRRQFVARPGSRSESNRILIVELCYALEEFNNALVKRLAERQTQALPRLASKRISPTQLGLSDPRLPMLAAEVNSLVTEIIEAVPNFSSALAQGSYGPIPFSMDNLAVKPDERCITTYLERLSVLDVRGGDALTFDDWWPARLRQVLNDGLLADTAEDSPNLAMHALNAFGSEDMSRTDSDADRNDQLLAEGRRRWQEYKEARRQT